MDITDVLRAWGRVLVGRTPSLSIEITRECPLRCPGCYAYGDDHLGGSLLLRQMRDYKGQDLVDGILHLVEEHEPLHVSLVGGEPLVRFRELSVLLPQLAARGIHTQVVTSAVRPIPLEWRNIPRLRISVSIDGLQPEHDARRKPATYDRILKHIEGHRITVHCTITRQMTERAGYLAEFVQFWSARVEVQKIWMSLFTPQKGETSYEILPPGRRQAVIDELEELGGRYEKLELPRRLLEVYRRPPETPRDCIFARTTRSITADLKRTITPCQFGGNPDCSQCGCIASAALEAVGRRTLPIGIRAGQLYNVSEKIGAWVASVREAAQLKPAKTESQISEAGS
ncbi:MAG TPA: radical SAM protein [Acidobacteriota bacterium]|nr:radical SAM protein [Acidobacteriota bacterium]